MSFQQMAFFNVHLEHEETEYRLIICVYAIYYCSTSCYMFGQGLCYMYNNETFVNPE